MMNVLVVKPAVIMMEHIVMTLVCTTLLAVRKQPKLNNML